MVKITNQEVAENDSVTEPNEYCFTVRVPMRLKEVNRKWTRGRPEVDPKQTGMMLVPMHITLMKLGA